MVRRHSLGSGINLEFFQCILYSLVPLIAHFSVTTITKNGKYDTA